MALKDLVREATEVIERLCIEAALELTGDNRASAAEMLGLSRQSLYVKLRRYGLGDLGRRGRERRRRERCPTAQRPAAPARTDWPAALELLKPITWFAPMWAFGCGVVSAGVPLGGPVGGGAGRASRWPGRWCAATSQAANDWFDRHVDAINEPGRPIPSGRLPGRTGLVDRDRLDGAVAAGGGVAGARGRSGRRWWGWRWPGRIARRRCG